MVVLCILALVSASALMMVRLPLKRSEHALAVERVISMDAMARQRARVGSRCQLRLNQGEQTVSVVMADSNSGQRSGAASDLVDHVVFDRPMRVLAGRVLVGESEIEKIADQVVIEYDRYGQCATFAIGWGDPPGSWLLVLGATGQVYVNQDHATVIASVFPRANAR